MTDNILLSIIKKNMKFMIVTYSAMQIAKFCCVNEPHVYTKRELFPFSYQKLCSRIFD